MTLADRGRVWKHRVTNDSRVLLVVATRANERVGYDSSDGAKAGKSGEELHGCRWTFVWRIAGDVFF